MDIVKDLKDALKAVEAAKMEKSMATDYWLEWVSYSRKQGG